MVKRFILCFAILLILSSPCWATFYTDFTTWRNEAIAAGLNVSSQVYQQIGPNTFTAGGVTFANTNSFFSFFRAGPDVGPGSISPGLFGIAFEFSPGPNEMTVWDTSSTSDFFDDPGTFIGFISDVDLRSVEAHSGFASIIGDFHVATSVPEPGTLLLLGTGLAGLAGYGYRFRRKKKA